MHADLADVRLKIDAIFARRDECHDQTVLAAEYAVLAKREVELMDAIALGCVKTVAVGLKDGAQLAQQLGVAAV